MSDSAPPATQTTDPAAEIRGLIGYHKVRRYKLAAAVDTSPNVLSAMLNGRRPLPPDLAAKIRRVIEEEIG